MKAIVLAAGYATRLYPLTQTVAKPLLPVGGRPMLDWILDRIADVPELDAVHVVTNHKFADSFQRWAEAHERGLEIDVHDDGSTGEDDRLGAIGDIQFVVRQAGLSSDDLLVGLYDVGNLELAKQFGVVAVDEDDRVVEFVEKPSNPPSTLAATATYIYHRAHVPLLETYLAEGNSPDQPGRMIAWLHERAPVYGYRFTGEWIDIGGTEQLLDADNRLRARAGLPTRTEYALD
jgi:glucose-1-phosphate thymidylyltransferase